MTEITTLINHKHHDSIPYKTEIRQLKARLKVRQQRIEELESIIADIFSNILFSKCLLDEHWANFALLDDIKDLPAVQEILRRRN